MLDLPGVLKASAERFPDKDALIMGDRRLTYSELDDLSTRFAEGLLRLGLKRYERVGTLLVNSLEWPVIFLGIIKAGATVVPLDIRYKIEELAAILNEARPHFFITESASLKAIIDHLPRFDFIRQVINLGTEYEDRFPSYRQLIEPRTDRIPLPVLNLDDIIDISYTSGPTTAPHGSMMSHRNLVQEATVSRDGFLQTEKDVVMLYALPLHHMFGLATVLLTSLLAGSTLVLVPGTGISIMTLMESIEKYKGTILNGVPYIFALMIKTVRREGMLHNLSSLRICASGGAMLPVDIVKQFQKLFGLRLLDIYGMTESVSQVTCPSVDGSGKIGSCGKPLPGWELKVVDNDGNELPHGVPGEIWVRGFFMQGYYNNPEATAKVVTDGWLHTGDLGKIDEDGYVYVTGLKKRMLILKGQNVYPVDVEQVLLSHPAIAEAKVVGAPDKLRGEVVRAYIRLKPGQRLTKQQIKQFCLEHMADYKCPREIVFQRASVEKDACLHKVAKS